MCDVGGEKRMKELSSRLGPGRSAVISATSCARAAQRRPFSAWLERRTCSLLGAAKNPLPLEEST